MTMQDALQAALDRGVFARPMRSVNYWYGYELQGKNYLVKCFANDRNHGMRSDFWRTMTKAEIEDEWVLCDAESREINVSSVRRAAERNRPRTLSDLFDDPAA